MLKIYTLGEDILKKKASLVPEIDGQMADFTRSMIETMDAGKGIGLAATQVGELLRVFVTRVEHDVPRVFINPDLIETSIETGRYEEGCLSIPGLWADVVRPLSIIVQAWNERGKPFTLEATGILGRVIQHEFDHLNGTLFIDRLTEKKRDRMIALYNKRIRM